MARADFCVGVRPEERGFVQPPPFLAKNEAFNKSHLYTRMTCRDRGPKFTGLARGATSDENTARVINQKRDRTRELSFYPALPGSYGEYDPVAEFPSLRIVPRTSCKEHSSYQRFGQTYCTGRHHEVNGNLVKLTDLNGPNARNGKHSYSSDGTWLDARALFLDPIFKFSSDYKIRDMGGPGQVEVLSCTSVVEYPAGDQKYILHTVVPPLINPLLVVNALQNGGYIRGPVDRTALETTFLLNLCDPGHYEIDLRVGKCTAHLLLYEPQHKGHQGCFAAGYSYFLCGLYNPAVQRVIIRADTPETHVVISRSYSSDCESFTQSNRKCSPKSGAKAVVAPLEEVNPNISHEWEQTLRNEERNLLKEFLNIRHEPGLEQSQSPASEAPVVHRHTPQMEEPLMSRTKLLRALGVFIMDPEKLELKMRNFPCEQCDGALFREMRSLVQRSNGQERNKRFDNSSPKTLKPCKYFAQRFRLVTRFNQSLNLSDVAWFSICPEEISKHIGRRIAILSRKLGRKIRIMDPFCGAGGNIVQAARMDEVLHAYASDINESEVQCAQRMAELYEVKEKCSFVVSDVFHLKPQFFDAIDAIVCSPPWGGPSYLEGVYDLSSMEPSYNDILSHCAKFTKNMAFLLPRNICIDQLVESAAAADSRAAVELEINLLTGKPKTSTVYYGGLVNQ